MPCTSICGTTILSQPDFVHEPVTLAALPRLPRDDGGPVFAEPWQANAFALAVKLSEQGHFTWKEWAGALADTLKAAADRGEPDDGSRYYDHWLATLERLAMAKGLTDRETLVARKDAWIHAYRNTPHGRPVELPQSQSNPDKRWILAGLDDRFRRVLDRANTRTWFLFGNGLRFRASDLPRVPASARCWAYGTPWSRIISLRCRRSSPASVAARRPRGSARAGGWGIR